MTGPDLQPGADDLDPIVATVLQLLWRALREAQAQQGSLARLSKRAGVAMSTLKRRLATLEDAGLVRVAIDERGRACALLTTDGLALCSELFAGAADQGAFDATSLPSSFNAASVPDDQA